MISFQSLDFNTDFNEGSHIVSVVETEKGNLGGLKEAIDQPRQKPKPKHPTPNAFILMDKFLNNNT